MGRELKGESAVHDMEKSALDEKKYIESKDRLLKMVESGKMTQEDCINIISQLDEGDPYYGQDYGKMHPHIDNTQKLPRGGTMIAKPKQKKKPRSAGGLQTMELRPGDTGHSAMMNFLKRKSN